MIKKLSKTGEILLTKRLSVCYHKRKLKKARYKKIVEDGRVRPTEGVKLSGDRKIGNCYRIALRRSSRKASAEGAKRTENRR